MYPNLQTLVTQAKAVFKEIDKKKASGRIARRRFAPERKNRSRNAVRDAIAANPSSVKRLRLLQRHFAQKLRKQGRRNTKKLYLRRFKSLKNQDKTMNQANPNASTPSQAPYLPSEVWQSVFQRLESEDVKSIRLASKEFADLGLRFLIDIYVFQPRRKDFERLEMIAEQKPEALSVTKAIRFETGFMDACMLRESLKGLIWHRGIEDQQRWPRRHKKAQEEYRKWNDAWHDAGQQYTNVDVVQKALSKFKHLDTIYICQRVSGFKSRLLNQSWTYSIFDRGDRVDKVGYGESRPYLQDLSVKELEAIMDATTQSGKKLRHFYHDEFPTVFFRSSLPHAMKVLAPFQHLETLNLEFYFHNGEPPHSPADFWIGLGKALKLAPGLQELRLSDGRPYGTPYASECGWHTNDDYIPLLKILGNFRWEKLRKLQLEGMTLCEKHLSEFLITHASTLQDLHLCNITLFQGTIKGLLEDVRSFLSLKSFFMWGEINCTHKKTESLFLMPRNLRQILSERVPREVASDGGIRMNADEVYSLHMHQGFCPLSNLLPLRIKGEEIMDRITAFVLDKNEVAEWPHDAINEVIARIGNENDEGHRYILHTPGIFHDNCRSRYTRCCASDDAIDAYWEEFRNRSPST